MKPASLKQIKDEIATLSPQELATLTTRLISHKKEIKELVTYELFYKNDEQEYIQDVQNELSGIFEDVNTERLYFAKKTLRKVVRIANKFCKFTREKTTEIDIYIFVCKKMLELAIVNKGSQQINNLYASQLKKIDSLVSGLHPDLQHDYKKMTGDIRL